MPYNGSGLFTPEEPEYPAIPDTTILASDFNTIIADVASGLTIALPRDGQAQATNNIGMGNKKIYNLAAGVNPQDATNVGQVFTDPTFTATSPTGVSIVGTRLSVTVNDVTVNAPDFNVISTTGDITITDLEVDASIIDINATTSITVTAPSTTFVNPTTVNLSSASSAPNQAITDDSTKVANTHGLKLLRDSVRQILLAEVVGVNPFATLTINLAGISMALYDNITIVGSFFSPIADGTNLLIDVVTDAVGAGYRVTGNADHVVSGTGLANVTLFTNMDAATSANFTVNVCNSSGHVSGFFDGISTRGKVGDLSKFVTNGSFVQLGSNLAIQSVSIKSGGAGGFDLGKLQIYGQLT